MIDRVEQNHMNGLPVVCTVCSVYCIQRIPHLVSTVLMPTKNSSASAGVSRLGDSKAPAVATENSVAQASNLDPDHTCCGFRSASVKYAALHQTTGSVA